MFDRLLPLIVDEGKWLPVSLSAAVLLAAVQLYRQPRRALSARHRVETAMNLFFGATIGTWAR